MDTALGRGFRAVRRARAESFSDRVSIFVANVLPRRVVTFCVMRVWANATSGDFSHVEVPAVLVTEALDRWKD